MNKEDFKVSLQKLDLKGTEDNKDIVILKFTDDVNSDSLQSLNHMLGNLKKDTGFEHVNFCCFAKTHFNDAIGR